MFASITDPRKLRGRRHSLGYILSVAAAATLAGERSLTAMGEWAADQDTATLRRLGSSNGKPPSEATIRRSLSHPEVAKEFDARTCALVAARDGALADKGVAIDGKTLRGSRDGETVAVHMVSAVVHDAGVVVSQVRVPDKGNELAAVRPVLQPLDLKGAVVTGDAMFTQKNVVNYIVDEKQADYVLTVKDNQPTLREDIEALGLNGSAPPPTRRRTRGTVDSRCDASG